MAKTDVLKLQAKDSRGSRALADFRPQAHEASLRNLKAHDDHFSVFQRSIELDGHSALADFRGLRQVILPMMKNPDDTLKSATRILTTK